MCLTLLGGGGSRPSQTMSAFWPDLFLRTAPKYISLDPQLQVLIGKLQVASLQSPRCFYWPPLLLVSLKTRVALCNLFGQSHPGYLSWLSPPHTHTHNTSW